MLNVLLIILGGGPGAASRHAVVAWLQPPTGRFPLGVFAVNALGSLIIGAAPAREPWRALVVIGFLGGFTTFSAFAWDTLALIEMRRYGLAAAYVLATNVVCLLGAGAGWLLAGGSSRP